MKLLSCCFDDTYVQDCFRLASSEHIYAKNVKIKEL